MKIDLSYDYVKSLYQEQKFPFDEKAINVFGIRNKDMTADKWNDTLGIAYYPGKMVIAVSGTTDPGKSPLSKTEGVNPNGIFILWPGFYPKCFKKGMHHGKYRALVQAGDAVFKGVRDKDLDGELDMTGKLVTDVRGLNFHTTRWDKQVVRVGEFSQACQVCEVAKEYDEIMDVIYESSQEFFNYALFNQK